MTSKIFLGWDIGGANTKVCVFDENFNIIDMHVKNITIWSNFYNLNNFFKYISSLYSSYDIYNYITITAESCDNFKSRHAGVNQILNNCDFYISGKKYYYTNDNLYIKYDEATANTERLYSTNWMLTSHYLNNLNEINLIIDMGSTTTDFIYKNMSIKDNINDYSRLLNNTLLYAGVVRTPLAMISEKIEFSFCTIPLIKEVFATTGDIFNITNDIDFSKLDYSGADNLDYTKNNSFIRLSRSIGLDYDKKNEQKLIHLCESFKKILMNLVLNNIRLLYNDNLDEISLASVGEGRFLVEDLAIINSIKYKDIEKENFFSIKNVDDKLVYKNLTSALVVMNYFKIK